MNMASTSGATITDPKHLLRVIAVNQRDNVRRVAFGQRMLQLRSSTAASTCGIGLEHVTRARGARSSGLFDTDSVR